MIVVGGLLPSAQPSCRNGKTALICGLFDIEQEGDHWGPAVFPPAKLSDTPPHILALRFPGLTFDEKVVPGLSFVLSTLLALEKFGGGDPDSVRENWTREMERWIAGMKKWKREGRTPTLECPISFVFSLVRSLLRRCLGRRRNRSPSLTAERREASWKSADRGPDYGRI